MLRRFVGIQGIAVLALVGLIGCGPKGKQADTSTARATLERSLDAWKAGTSREDFGEMSPKVAVVDGQWQKGDKLVKYSVEGEGKPVGFDLRFRVKLSIEDKEGKKSEEIASYTVSTNPNLVIVREDTASDDKPAKKK